MDFSRKLQEYRRTNKLSQEELASRLGVSRQSVSKWEQGVSFPETEKLIELSSMMGVTIDSLLKDDGDLQSPVETDTLPPGAKPSFWERNWLTLVLAGALIATVLALVFVLRQTGDGNGIPMETETFLQQNTATLDNETICTTECPTEPPETEPIPEETEFVFRNQDLKELQLWFFRFARKYRLDYMPHFIREEGPPKDAGEYLYWAYAINLDNWGENAGKMTKDYVEETALMYYAVIPEQHRSHWKSWNYDAEAELYTAYPDGMKQIEAEYYLLNSIEVHQGYYTVHATRYYSPYYGYSIEEQNEFFTALQEGVNTELILASEITITFHLDHVFYEPVFYAFTEEFLTDLIS